MISSSRKITRKSRKPLQHMKKKESEKNYVINRKCLYLITDLIWCMEWEWEWEWKWMMDGLVWALSNDVTRWVIETNGQAWLLLHARGFSAPNLRRIPPHHLRVNPALVLPHARVVSANVELFLLHPFLHRHAWRHRRHASPQLVSAVLAGGQVGEFAPHFVPLVPDHQTGGISQLLAPPQRFHAHRGSSLVVRLQVLTRRGCERRRRRRRIGRSGGGMGEDNKGE